MCDATSGPTTTPQASASMPMALTTTNSELCIRHQRYERRSLTR